LPESLPEELMRAIEANDVRRSITPARRRLSERKDP
jgi:hypothetical protein